MHPPPAILGGALVRQFRPLHACAGLLGIAVAVGIAELVATVAGVISPRVASGDAVIRQAPQFAVHLAITTFGRHDKDALLATLAVVTLAFGAAIGLATRRRSSMGTTGFALWWFVTALAVTLDHTQIVAAAAVTGVGALAGWTTLRLLLRVAPGDIASTTEATEATASTASTDLDRYEPDRRSRRCRRWLRSMCPASRRS